MKKLKKYKPTRFMAKDSVYDKELADYAVDFIECLCHTKGTWAGKLFKLLDWQEQIIRDLFGIIKPNGYRQFNTAYVEIPKKNGKSELAAAMIWCGCVRRWKNAVRSWLHRNESYTCLQTPSIRCCPPRLILSTVSISTASFSTSYIPSRIENSLML